MTDNLWHLPFAFLPCIVYEVTLKNRDTLWVSLFFYLFWRQTPRRLQKKKPNSAAGSDIPSGTPAVRSGGSALSERFYNATALFNGKMIDKFKDPQL